MEAVDLRTLLGNDSVLVLRKLANLFAKGILINTKKNNHLFRPVRLFLWEKCSPCKLRCLLFGLGYFYYLFACPVNFNRYIKINVHSLL